MLSVAFRFRDPIPISVPGIISLQVEINLLLSPIHKSIVKSFQTPK